MDVNIAFLNGYINEKLYVKQFSAFEGCGLLEHDFELKKYLNGLKQAPRACMTS